jgi:hypothetical protein
MQEPEYAPYTPEHRAQQAGREDGEAAASWVFDGNTDDATYARVLRGITDGDPEVLDAYRPPDLSGEWADGETPATLAKRVDVVPHDGTLLLDDVCSIYEQAASEAFWAEIERVCREHASTSYRCPCCGDDVISTGPPCADCQEAGCEQTSDATGDLGYWSCQREDGQE